MKVAEVLGAATAIFLAFIVFSALAGPTPAYRFWNSEMERAVPADPNTIWRNVSILLYGGLFPLFIAFGLVVLTLVVGLSAMLKKEEESP
ncbi:MAG: hypothetical protein RMI43_06330 [Candidatus Caldarchaeum sp.]|nr:hypothetical protein [Candidatus Caldarchaeum sp.]MCX8201337.1 hypothetical protein [Candidatus Caldarchaeum sp.]MDW8063769.1 hypothetical protein [Candidatus Caldarchaeum sp.]MDW8435794.1 hypothetical protein [Candidatus Caldarchaeum sp.]